MSEISRKTKYSPFGKSDKGISLAIYIYWIILVLAQNTGEYDGESSMIMVLKLCLVMMLVIVFMRGQVSLTPFRFGLWLLFVVEAFYLFGIVEGNLSGSLIIYYCFPVILSFLVYVLKPYAQINKKDFLIYLKLVIAAVTYFAIYAIITEPEKIFSMSAATATYGNELSSIFISNHEYAMNLVFGITSCIICAQNSEKKYDFLYIGLIGLFGINLLATFSRTGYVACMAIILIFIAFSKKNTLRSVFIAGIIVGVVLLIMVPAIRNYVFVVLFKENNDAGRFEMWEYSIKYFKDLRMSEQLFGIGTTKTSAEFEHLFQHKSVHNSFIQVLLVWGVVGVIFLIGVFVFSIVDSIRIRKYDKNLSAIFLALTVSAVAFMFTNTSCLMQSPIDSFMLTAFTIVIPKYVRNAIKHGSFE